MKNKHYSIAPATDTKLYQNNSEYHINGVAYMVTSFFDACSQGNSTLQEKVFRIIYNQSAHLMAETNASIIKNEYTCLTAGMEEKCS